MCAYNPGVGYDTQSMGQGIQQAAQNLATGLREMQANKTMAGQAIARFEATAAANPDILKFLDAGQAPSAASSAYKSLLSGGTLPVQKAALLAQFADTFTNQQKQAQEAKAREMQLRQFQMQAQQMGDQIRRDELARNYAMSGAGGGILSPAMQNNPFFKQRGQALAAGTDISAAQMLEAQARMQPAPTKPQMVFQNREALEAKYPSAKFDYSMVEGPDGKITVSTVSPRAPKASELPPGYEEDPKGGIRPIKGSADDVKRSELMRKFDSQVKAQQIKAENVLDIINTATPKISKWTTGLAGESLSKLGGTDSADLKELIKTIEANVAFDTLTEMRANSPTGGALGNVSDTELGLLAGSIRSLKQSQSPEQLNANMEAVYRHYDRFLKSISGVNPDEGEKAEALTENMPSVESLLEKYK